MTSARGVTAPHGGSGGGGFFSPLFHPRAAIKHRLAVAVVPDITPSYVPQATDTAFVNAHDRKDAAISHNDPVGIEDADRSIAALERDRRNMRLDAILSRHVKRVRALPRQRRAFPHRSEFVRRNEKGEVLKDASGTERVDLMRWLGQVSCCSIVNRIHSVVFVRIFWFASAFGDAARP